MANSSATSSLKLFFASPFGSNHSLFCSLYDVDYLYSYAFIRVCLPFSIRAAFEGRACNLSLYLCFLELLLVGKSVSRSVKIEFKLSSVIKTFIYDLGQVFLTYLNLLRAAQESGDISMVRNK